jgi:hypothetical protein
MGGHELPSPGGAEGWPASEDLQPNHFYASYVFDQPEGRQADVVSVVAEAQRLGYPVRYWWLSDATELADRPDRLIVCVHHPRSDENAGMDLYNALSDRRVSWDELDTATVEEYVMLSRPVDGPGSIQRPNGAALFSALEPQVSAEQHESDSRDDNPLLAITLGDIQTAAWNAINRPLTRDEVKTVVSDLANSMAWQEVVRDAIVTGQQSGSIGPGGPKPEFIVESMETPAVNPESPLAPDGLDSIETRFLVYYTLWGLTLASAPDARSASQAVFGFLHGLVGKAGTEGVTIFEADQVRIGDLQVGIDSVEALEFPVDEHPDTATSTPRSSSPELPP